MGNFEKFGGGGDVPSANLDQCTKEELRQLHTETLGIDPESTWEDIHEETERQLGEGDFPDTECFFDLEKGENTCYSVPRIDCSDLDGPLDNLLD